MAEKSVEPGAPAPRDGSQTSGRTLPGLVWAFRFHADGTVEELAAGQPVLDRRDGLLWLHFNLADAGTAKSLDRLSGRPQSARSSLTGREEHQQLHSHFVVTLAELGLIVQYLLHDFVVDRLMGIVAIVVEDPH